MLLEVGLQMSEPIVDTNDQAEHDHQREHSYFRPSELLRRVLGAADRLYNLLVLHVMIPI